MAGEQTAARVRAPRSSVRRAGAAIVLATRRFREQNMAHHAAAITYHSVVALFPALLLGVSLLGLLGTERTLDDLERFLTRMGADQRLVQGVTEAARNAVEARATSAAALVVAVVVALVVVSSAFITAQTALNIVVEAEDRSGAVRRRLRAVGAMLVVILLAVGALVAVFLGGGLAEEVFGAVGLGETAAAVWTAVRLPVAALLAMTAFAWIYYVAPSVPQPRWQWISLGAAVAVVVWLAASGALFVYAANFDSYNKTYGAFATAILLLIWLWLTNLALLFGAEINAAGRYAERTGTPLSPAGDSPEHAQRAAAAQRVGRPDGHAAEPDPRRDPAAQ